MFRTFTWIPGHDEDWAKAMAGRFANTSTANNTTHRIPMGTLIFGSLTVKATANFRLIDSFIIFLTILACVA
jgi:hypothetical protein